MDPQKNRKDLKRLGKHLKKTQEDQRKTRGRLEEENYNKRKSYYKRGAHKRRAQLQDMSPMTLVIIF